MKLKPAKQLAIDLCSRSSCKIQVAAVLRDSHGIFAWGWNNPGNGEGWHAEAFALNRANKRRLEGSVITVAMKKPSGIIGMALPCEECMPRLLSAGIKTIEYTDRGGAWQRINI